MHRWIEPIKVVNLFIQLEALPCVFRSFVGEDKSFPFLIKDIPIFISHPIHSGTISYGHLIHTHAPFRTSAISVYFIVSFLLVKIFLCFAFRRKIKGIPCGEPPSTLRSDHMLSCVGTDEPRSVMTFARTLRALHSYFISVRGRVYRRPAVQVSGRPLRNQIVRLTYTVQLIQHP